MLSTICTIPPPPLHFPLVLRDGEVTNGSHFSGVRFLEERFSRPPYVFMILSGWGTKKKAAFDSIPNLTSLVFLVCHYFFFSVLLIVYSLPAPVVVADRL